MSKETEAAPQQGYSETPLQLQPQPQPGHNQPPPGYTPQQQQGYAQPQPGYAQPQPGYAQPQQGYAQPQSPGGAVVVTQTVQKKPSKMRNAIPALPLPLAIILGIVNFIIPGFGTILAGFSVLCCGNVGQSGGGRVGTFCINFWVGLLQMLTCWFFLLGWIWSIIWGIALITLGASGGGGKTTTTTTVVQTGGYAQQGAVVTAVNT